MDIKFAQWTRLFHILFIEQTEQRVLLNERYFCAFFFKLFIVLSVDEQRRPEEVFLLHSCDALLIDVWIERISQ